MSDSMVVARMTPEKKERVARTLSSLGTNATQAINALYDYIDKNAKLPDALLDSSAQSRAQRYEEACAWMSEMPRLPQQNAFAAATDEEIKIARLKERGLL